MSLLDKLKPKTKIFYSSSETADEIIGAYAKTSPVPRAAETASEASKPNFIYEEGGQLIYDVACLLYTSDAADE